jgi:nucleoside phosphorylase
MATERAPDVLLVAAHLPELCGLRRWLGEALRADFGGFDVSADAVGIGLVAAAGGLTALLERIRPRALVLVGTCGAYQGQGIDVGQVVVGRRIHLVSAAVALGRGAFPQPMSTVVDVDPALSAGLAEPGLRAVDVATTLAITIEDGLSATMGRREGCHVEHLEAFAAAQRAASRGVPFATVLGVANQCGSSAREQWKANHRRVGDEVARHVAAWLERGAPGVRAGRPQDGVKT